MVTYLLGSGLIKIEFGGEDEEEDEEEEEEIFVDDVPEVVEIVVEE